MSKRGRETAIILHNPTVKRRKTGHGPTVVNVPRPMGFHVTHPQNVNNSLMRAAAQRAAEIKSIDIGNLQLTSGTVLAPTITLMNGIQLGAGSYQRIGRRVRMISYSFNGGFQINPSVAVNTTIPDYQMRWVVVYDRQPNGANPAFSDIFQDQGPTGTTATFLQSSPNTYNKDRFVILESKLIYVPQIQIGGTADEQANFSITWGANGDGNTKGDFNVLAMQSFKRLNLESIYSANVGNVTDLTTGSLLWIMADTTSVATRPIRWQGSLRLRYLDD